MSWEVRTMQSKTSCFNGTVFRKTLSRCWPLWAATTLVLIFLLPVGLLDCTSPGAFAFDQSIKIGRAHV